MEKFWPSQTCLYFFYCSVELKTEIVHVLLTTDVSVMSPPSEPQSWVVKPKKNLNSVLLPTFEIRKKATSPKRQSSIKRVLSRFKFSLDFLGYITQV